MVLSGSSEYPKRHRGQPGKDPYIVILPTQHSWCYTTDLPQSGQESRSHRCCQKDCLLGYEPIKIKVSSGPRPFHFLPLLPSPEFCAVPQGYGCRVMVQPSLPSGPDLRIKEVIQGKYQVIQLQPSNSWPLPATASFKYLVVFEKKRHGVYFLRQEYRAYKSMHALRPHPPSVVKNKDISIAQTEVEKLRLSEKFLKKNSSL